jgi:hypothetical protein
VNFGLFSLPTALAGVFALAALLWIAQRLRVRHREVEVLSTMFWQAALEETRARVFVRRFRHWPAWVLLVVIASLLWLLAGRPRTTSRDGVRHIVLVDWSVDDARQRADDLDLAIDLAATLPVTDREIVAVSTELETLLHAGEPLELARLRSQAATAIAPDDLDWALAALASRASSTTRIAIHLVGDGRVDRRRWRELERSVDSAESLQLDRVTRDRLSLPARPRLVTLGAADSARGDWRTVDVWLRFTTADDQPLDPQRIAMSQGGEKLNQPLVVRGDGTFELLDMPADGSEIDLTLDGAAVGALTLPSRRTIRVRMDADTPASLRQLIALDPACEVVESQADVRVGSAAVANFRLSTIDEPAFLIQSDADDPQAALRQLVDELALRQVDATSIAEQSGQVVDVQVAAGSKRTLAVWQSLFSPAFDFQESRACPVFVSRSIRWLAQQPPLVEWAELGERLPAAAPPFDRANGQLAATLDGRSFRTTRLAAKPAAEAQLAAHDTVASFTLFNPASWLGLLVVGLLIGEWILFQRGRLP